MGRRKVAIDGWKKRLEVAWDGEKMVEGKRRIMGTLFEFGVVLCFTDFRSGFLFKVRVRVKVGGGVRVRAG